MQAKNLRSEAGLKSRKQIIGVIGDANVANSSSKYKMAVELGRLLVEDGYRICCGGLGGIMEAVCKGAKSAKNNSSGDTIGILPGTDPDIANPFIDIPLATGLDIARNMIIANCDAIIAIGGGSGTLSEIALAWQLKRLIITLRVDGWSGELADRRIDSRDRFKGRIPRDADHIFGVNNPIEAIQVLNENIAEYKQRHLGISQSGKLR